MIANKNSKYILRSWVPIDKLDWDSLSSNPYAIQLLEANQDKINWNKLSKIPEAIDILKANTHRDLDWDYLSSQPWAIELLEVNTNKINWKVLSSNPAAIHILEANQDKIDWATLRDNPSAIQLFEANTDKLKNSSGTFSFSTTGSFKGFGCGSAFGGTATGSDPKPILELLETNLNNIAEYSNDHTMLEHIQDKLNWSLLSKNPSIFISEDIQLEELQEWRSKADTKIVELSEQLCGLKDCQAIQATDNDIANVAMRDRFDAMSARQDTKNATYDEAIDSLYKNSESFNKYIIWNYDHEIAPMQRQIDSLNQRLFMMMMLLMLLSAHVALMAVK